MGAFDPVEQDSRNYFAAVDADAAQDAHLTALIEEKVEDLMRGDPVYFMGFRGRSDLIDKCDVTAEAGEDAAEILWQLLKCTDYASFVECRADARVKLEAAARRSINTVKDKLL